MKHAHLVIEKIVNGGFGLGRLENGQILLCRYGLPREEVIVIAERKKKNLSFGRITEIVKPSADRINPPCSYYTLCGGCDLQHASYRSQLHIKETVVRELAERQGLGEETPVRPIIEAPNQFRYRQRIRLHLETTGKMGFHRQESRELVEIESCLLAPEPVNDVLVQLREFNEFHQLAGNCRELEIGLDPDRQSIVLLASLTRKPRPRDSAVSQTLAERIHRLSHVYLRSPDSPITLAGKSSEQLPFLHTCRPDGLEGRAIGFRWEPGGFCQVNLEQNQRLQELVLEYCNPGPDDRILDLYCGMGNFSIPLALRCKELLGFEGQGSAIRSARRNAEAASLENCSFQKGAIEKVCHDLVRARERFDTVLVDPPRTGIPGLAGALSSLTGKTLVYISCDPATLCRDLSELKTAGFSVLFLQPVDMFPQTHHIETIALLKKS